VGDPASVLHRALAGGSSPPREGLVASDANATETHERVLTTDSRRQGRINASILKNSQSCEATGGTGFARHTEAVRAARRERTEVTACHLGTHQGARGHRT